jgi:hypothetical protein
VKPGDLVRISSRWSDGWSELALCYDPTVIRCSNHHGSYSAIQMINTQGSVLAYPIDRWTFEVISETR